MALVKITVVPNFLRAKTPEDLRKAMLMNNARMGAWVEYFDIQKQDGQWIAWFYEDLTSAQASALTQLRAKK